MAETTCSLISMGSIPAWEKHEPLQFHPGFSAQNLDSCKLLNLIGHKRIHVKNKVKAIKSWGILQCLADVSSQTYAVLALNLPAPTNKASRRQNAR